MPIHEGNPESTREIWYCEGEKTMAMVSQPNHRRQILGVDASKSDQPVIRRALSLIALDAGKAKPAVDQAIAQYPDDYLSWFAAFALRAALQTQWADEIVAHMARPYTTYGDLPEQALRIVPQNHQTGYGGEEMFFFFGVYWGRSSGWNRGSSGAWTISTCGELPNSDSDIVREIENAITLAPESERASLAGIRNAWIYDAKKLMNQYLTEYPKPFHLQFMDRLIGS